MNAKKEFWKSIEGFIAFRDATGLTIEDIHRIPAEWDRDLGITVGWQLLELLGHFYSPKLSFELKPPAVDLEEKARQAIFWKEIVGVRTTSKSSWTIPKSSWEEIAGVQITPECGYKEIGDIQKKILDVTTPKRSLEKTLAEGGICLSEALDVFRIELRDKIGYNFGTHLGESFGHRGLHKNFFKSRLLEDLRRSGLDDELWEGKLWADLWHCLGGSLWLSLFYAAGFLIVGDKTKNFRPLLDFWRSGNLPIGFNSQNEIVVLCDETSPPKV